MDPISRFNQTHRKKRIELSKFDKKGVVIALLKADSIEEDYRIKVMEDIPYSKAELIVRNQLESAVAFKWMTAGAYEGLKGKPVVCRGHCSKGIGCGQTLCWCVGGKCRSMPVTSD